MWVGGVGPGDWPGGGGQVLSLGQGQGGSAARPLPTPHPQPHSSPLQHPWFAQQLAGAPAHALPPAGPASLAAVFAHRPNSGCEACGLDVCPLSGKAPRATQKVQEEVDCGEKWPEEGEWKEWGDGGGAD